MLSMIGLISIGVGAVYGYYRHKDNSHAVSIEEETVELTKDFARDVTEVMRRLKDRAFPKGDETLS